MGSPTKEPEGGTSAMRPEGGEKEGWSLMRLPSTWGWLPDERPIGAVGGGCVT